MGWRDQELRFEAFLDGLDRELSREAEDDDEEPCEEEPWEASPIDDRRGEVAPVWSKLPSGEDQAA